VAELITKTPCEGLLPVTEGPCTLIEVLPGELTSVTPFKSQQKKASEALKTACGLAFPAAGRATGKEGVRAIWFGRGQAMVVGVSLPKSLGKFAALTDQSDGWAVMRLEGAGAEDVLARLIPLDLSANNFKRNHTARTSLNHIMASITRVGTNAFEIMVMRSFAASAVHELHEAMKSFAARP